MKKKEQSRENEREKTKKKNPLWKQKPKKSNKGETTMW
jgi:hypothetical protein